MSVPLRPPSICAPPAVKASSTCSVGASVSEDDSLDWLRTWKRVSLKKFRPTGPDCDNRKTSSVVSRE